MITIMELFRAHPLRIFNRLLSPLYHKQFCFRSNVHVNIKNRQKYIWITMNNTMSHIVYYDGMDTAMALLI